MDIDFRDARGSFQYTPKGKPGPDGEHGNLKITSKLSINVPLDFLDKYLEGHNTGAQPSSVFWREADPGNLNGNIIPRYMGLKSMELEVSQERRYIVKIKAPKPMDWDPAAHGPWNGMEVTLHGYLVKKAVASMAVNGALVDLTIVGENQQPELTPALSRLVVLQEVQVDMWLMDRDLPLGAGGQEEGAGEDDDEDADQDEADRDEVVERAAEAHRVGAGGDEAPE